jgi:hypothetical protein
MNYVGHPDPTGSRGVLVSATAVAGLPVRRRAVKADQCCAVQVKTGPSGSLESRTARMSGLGWVTSTQLPAVPL